MGNIDWATLINWIAKGFIDFLFSMIGAAIGAWTAYQFAKKRDDQKLQQELKRDAEAKLRDNILHGTHSMDEFSAIVELQQVIDEIRSK